MSYEKIKKVVLSKEEKAWQHLVNKTHSKTSKHIIKKVREEWYKWYNLKQALESE